METTHDEAKAQEVEKKFSQETWEVLRLYQQAVDEFLYEHSDIQPSGALFIKFHADDMLNVRKRIWSRFRGWYHRNSLEENMRRAREATKRREDFLAKKAEKERRREAEKLRKRNLQLGIGTRVLPREQRIAAEKEVAAINEARRLGLPSPYEVVQEYGERVVAEAHERVDLAGIAVMTPEPKGWDKVRDFFKKPIWK